MSRAEFETIVAAAPRERLVYFEKVVSTNLAAGAVETYLFYSQPGTIFRMLNVHLVFPQTVGATTGNYEMWMSYITPNINLLYGRSNYNEDMLLYCNMFTKSFNSNAPIAAQLPTDQSAVIGVLQNTYFDSVAPMRIDYKNGTNANYTSTRIMRIWGIERTVS